MRFSIRGLIRCGLLLAVAPAAFATTWYVNGVSGSDTDNCLSATTACKTIGHAISFASSGDSIKVGPATYSEDLTIGINLNIVGSGAGTTIVAGNDFGTVITIPPGASVSVSALTITKGYGSNGGGVYNRGIRKISSSTISGNTAYCSNRGGCAVYGGGINNFGAVTINNSTISRNTAFAAGCGITGTICMGIGYLYYVLDLWFERVVKPRLRGEAYVVRYIDDFVLCFQYCADALRAQEALVKRLRKFSLTLEPTKTKLVEFGRFASRHASKRGRKRPETIYFLGFTLYCTRKQKGNFRIGMRTEKTRLRRALTRLQDQMRRIRHLSLQDQVNHLNQMLRGHYAYYGVAGNIQALLRVHRAVERYWCKMLSGRSWKATIRWEQFHRITDQFPLQRPKAVSPLQGAASYRHTVKQLLKSVVRQIRTLRSVGAGGWRLPPATRWEIPDETWWT